MFIQKKLKSEKIKDHFDWNQERIAKNGFKIPKKG